MRKKGKFFQLLFTLSIYLKGLDGLAELVGGIFFVFLKTESILKIISQLLHYNYFKIPNPLIERWMANLSQELTTNIEMLIALILIGNGLIKIILAVNILLKKIWAFRIALIFLTLLLCYQFIKAFYFKSLVFNLFNVLDLIVVMLIFMQYKYLQSERQLK